MRSRSTLNLNQALAIDRLEEFVRQEEAFGAELVKGSDFERALALLITQRHKSDSPGPSDNRVEGDRSCTR
jgi:hypothetical protein